MKKLNGILQCLILFAGFTTVYAAINGQVDINTTYQTMDGFGGGITWYNGTLHDSPQKQAICDALFTDLDLDIVRIRNAYGRNEESTITYDQQTYQAAISVIR